MIPLRPAIEAVIDKLHEAADAPICNGDHDMRNPENVDALADVTLEIATVVDLLFAAISVHTDMPEADISGLIHDEIEHGLVPQLRDKAAELREKYLDRRIVVGRSICI